MELTKLCKDDSSGRNGCPTVYLADNGEFVVQAPQVDQDTFSRLENVLPGEEQAVRIRAEVVLGAVARYQARTAR
jgi:hypothetical protein